MSGCIDSDELWTRPGSSPFLSLGPGWTLPAGQVSFGLTVSYEKRPLVLHTGGPAVEPRQVFLVDNQLAATLLLALGVTERLELTIAAPLTLFEDGAGLDYVNGGGSDLPRSAIRDPRFGFAYAFLAHPRVGKTDGLSLVGRMEFGAPLGDPDAFARAHTATAVPALTADLVLGRFDFSAEAGARVRGITDIGTTRWGTQLSFALGGAVRVWDRARLDVGAEAFALPGVVSERGAGALAPGEWMVDARTAPLLAGDVSFAVNGGGAIPFGTSTLGAPLYRFGFGVRYAPRGTDQDGDGIPDARDQCPTEPEDQDGFQDQDGCPDPDNDKDGIPDKLDRCRDEPEDFDGYQDHDGCPDRDDDHDGIPDVDDKCRMQAEDFDGFEDADGCPDLDNDKDGIPDDKDQCPNAPEDFDGVRDDDGCPDLDDDRDGVPDAIDRCPKLAEDRDGFQDADGCPEPDNDQDGILDVNDLCPNVAETIDGNADQDGCPEPGATSRVSWSGDRIELTRPTRFAAGQSKVSGDLERELKMMAQLARGRGEATLIIIEAFGDRPGDESKAATALAARRAAAARDVFIAAGIAAVRITAAAGDLHDSNRPAAAPPFDITVAAKPKE